VYAVTATVPSDFDSSSLNSCSSAPVVVEYDPEVVEETTSPTAAPTQSPTSPAFLTITKQIGETVEDDGKACVLQDDCSCLGLCKRDGDGFTYADSAGETFTPGSTATDGNGDECLLQDDCSCEIIQVRAGEFESVPSGTKGDPHFIMWNGRHFDFHGGCDLVLLDGKILNDRLLVFSTAFSISHNAIYVSFYVSSSRIQQWARLEGPRAHQG